MKSKLMAFIKLARAGGSTWARRFMSERDPDGYQRIVINGDNIRLSLYNQRYCSNGEGFVHAIEEVMTRALLLNPFQRILLDDTHTTVNSIRKVLQLDSDAEFIYIPTPLDICKERAILSFQPDLVDKGVLDRMYRNLQETQWYSMDKWYFDENLSLSHDSEACRFDVTESRILTTVETLRREVKRS